MKISFSCAAFPVVDVISLQWENGTENYFWESDPECGKYRTRFVVSHSLPTRALISYPGSGNTWIREKYLGSYWSSSCITVLSLVESFVVMKYFHIVTTLSHARKNQLKAYMPPSTIMGDFHPRKEYIIGYPSATKPGYISDEVPGGGRHRRLHWLRLQ